MMLAIWGALVTDVTLAQMLFRTRARFIQESQTRKIMSVNNEQQFSLLIVFTHRNITQTRVPSHRIL